MTIIQIEISAYLIIGKPFFGKSLVVGNYQIFLTIMVIDCLNMNLWYWKIFYPLRHSLCYILLLAYQCDAVCGQYHKYHDDAFNEFYHEVFKVLQLLLICCIFTLRPSFHCIHTSLHMWPCTNNSGEMCTYTLKLIREAIPRLTLMRRLIQVSFALSMQLH